MQNILVIQSLDIEERKVSKSRGDLCFKLSENFFKLFFNSCANEEIVLSSTSIGACEELTEFASGKEFSLLQTSSGKVSFSVV